MSRPIRVIRVMRGSVPQEPGECIDFRRRGRGNGCCTGKTQRECAALIQRTRYGQASAHRFRDTLGQRQSQARSVNLRGRDHRTAIERLENVREVRSRDSEAMIGDVDSNLFRSNRGIVDTRFNANPAFRAAVL